MTTHDDTIRVAYIAMTIARDDLVRISSPISRRIYGDKYDVTRDRALAALESANHRYNDLTGRRI